MSTATAEAPTRTPEQIEADLRADLLTRHPEGVWNTSETRERFEVVGFCAPFCTAVRKADKVRGSLEFTHYPRFYFGFVPH